MFFSDVNLVCIWLGFSFVCYHWTITTLFHSCAEESEIQNLMKVGDDFNLEAFLQLIWQEQLIKEIALTLTGQQ